MQTYLKLLLLAALTLPAAGCMNTRLIGEYSTSQVQAKETTRFTLVWGLLQSKDIPAECESKSICKVTHQTNLGYILLSAATIGLVVPQKLLWYCCPSVEPEETLR